MHRWVLSPACAACFMLVLGIAIPSTISFLGFRAAGYTVPIDLDVANYLTADSEVRWTEDAVAAAVEAHKPPDDSDSSIRRLSAGYYGSTLDFFYSSRSGDNIFTAAALMEIRDFERSIEAFTGYEDLCRKSLISLPSPNGSVEVERCFPAISVVKAAFASTSSLNVSHILETYDGQGQSSDIEDLLLEMVRQRIEWFTDAGFGVDNLASKYTRSRYITRYSIATKATFEAWHVRLFDELLSKLDVESPYQHILVSWYDDRQIMLKHELLEALKHDVLFSLGSVCFVAVFLVVQLRSVLLALAGILSIVLSFTTAFFFYYVVIGYETMSLMNFLCLFFVTGIAADDILVLCSTYQLSGAMSEFSDGSAGTAELRMIWTWKKASASMLVTTATTCGSFLSLTLSTLKVVRGFGTFMALSVGLNYINVVVIVASLLLLRDQLIRRFSWMPNVSFGKVAAKGCWHSVVRSEGSSSNADGALTWELVIEGLDTTKLSFGSRLLGNILSPLLWRARLPLVILAPILAGFAAWRVFVDIKPQTGQPKVFHESLNLARLATLRYDAFKSYAWSDSVTALSSFTDYGSPVVKKNCPESKLGDGSTVLCWGNGVCLETIQVCVCSPGFIGLDCSAQKIGGKLQVQPNRLEVTVAADADGVVRDGPWLHKLQLLNAGDAELSWTLSEGNSSNSLNALPWLSTAITSGQIGPRSAATLTPSSTTLELRINLAGQQVEFSDSLELAVFAYDNTSAGQQNQVMVTVPVSVSVLSELRLSALSLKLQMLPETYAGGIEQPPLQDVDFQLTPAFDPRRRSYSIALPYRAVNFWVVSEPARPANASAVNGVLVGPGVFSQLIMLRPGQSLQVAVDAMIENTGLNGSYTLFLTRAWPEVPGPVELMQVVAGDGLLQVLFSPPKDDGGLAISGYKVGATPLSSSVRRLADNSSLAVVPCVLAPCWSHAVNGQGPGEPKCCLHTISSLQNGIDYGAEVVAVNGLGPGASSQPAVSESSWAFPPLRPFAGPAPLPSVNSAPAVERHHGLVVLSMKRSSIASGGAIPLGRFTCASSPENVVGSSTTGSGITLKGLKTNLNYSFTCSFANARGSNGSMSAPSPPSPPVTPVVPPPGTVDFVSLSFSRSASNGLLAADLLTLTLSVPDLSADQISCVLEALAGPPVDGQQVSASGAVPLEAVTFLSSSRAADTPAHVQFQGLPPAVGQLARCQALNSDFSREPQSMPGPWQEMVIPKMPDAPSVSVTVAVEGNSLAVLVAWQPDSWGPASSYLCRAVTALDMELQAVVEQPVSSSGGLQTLFIGSLLDAVEYRVSCLVRRQVPGLPSSIVEGQASTPSKAVLMSSGQTATSTTRVAGTAANPTTKSATTPEFETAEITTTRASSMTTTSRTMTVTSRTITVTAVTSTVTTATATVTSSSVTITSLSTTQTQTGTMTVTTRTLTTTSLTTVVSSIAAESTMSRTSLTTTTTTTSTTTTTTTTSTSSSLRRPPGSPSISIATISGPQSLTLSLSPAADGLGESPATYFSCETVQEDASARVVSSSEGSSTSVRLVGLQPAVLLTFRCAAHNPFGTSEFSNAFLSLGMATLAFPAPHIFCLRPWGGEVSVELSAPPPGREYGGDGYAGCRADIPGSAAFTTSASQNATAAGETLSLIVRGLRNGMPVRILCWVATSEGFETYANLSAEITPGVPAIADYQLSSGPAFSWDDFESIVSQELSVPPSKMSVEVAEEGLSFSGCWGLGWGESSCGSEGSHCRRLAAAGLQLRVKVMLESRGDLAAENLLQALERLPASAALSQQMGGSFQLSVLQRPFVATSAFLDSSLKWLRVVNGSTSQSLTPAFQPAIYSYQAGVNTLTFSVDARANGTIIAPVIMDGLRLLPVSYQFSEVDPVPRMVAILVRAQDGSSSIYKIEVSFAPNNCTGTGVCINSDPHWGGLFCNTASGVCECSPGWEGPKCEAYCPSVPACGYPDRGFCDLGWRGCKCYSSFSGQACSNRTCPNCLNNGTCVPGNQSLDSKWSCNCLANTTGDLCELRTCPDNCLGKGDCSTRSGVCDCFSGYEGSNCGLKGAFMHAIESTVEVVLTLGLRGYSLGKGQGSADPVYEPDFNATAHEVQTWLSETLLTARSRPELKVRKDHVAWYEEFAPMSTSGRTIYSPNGFDSQMEYFWSQASNLKHHGDDVGTEGPEHTGRVVYIISRLRINVLYASGTSELQPEFLLWKAYVDERNWQAPPGGQFLLTSSTFTRLDVELGVLSSTVSSFLTCALITLIMLLIFTGNLLLAFLTVASTLLTVIFLASIVISFLGWEFGAVQAIAFTTFVGVSVDYSLHLAHAFHSSKQKDRRLKVTEALIYMGMPILGGALTTAASCIFLFPCWVQFFYQLGVMMFINTWLAVGTTLFFLAPLLMTVGPSHHFCDVRGAYFLLSSLLRLKQPDPAASAVTAGTFRSRSRVQPLSASQMLVRKDNNSSNNNNTAAKKAHVHGLRGAGLGSGAAPPEAWSEASASASWRKASKSSRAAVSEENAVSPFDSAANDTNNNKNKNNKNNNTPPPYSVRRFWK
ncbi:unnamed protein product [Polarella glacialis]|uniref:Uncharacterized protein n=1 Tax=Polarella glacialis TaxID=89957 RepID=A0A813EEV0_POLGL|nr:unnamed protein product [Polarella glacialis]